MTGRRLVRVLLTAAAFVVGAGLVVNTGYCLALAWLNRPRRGSLVDWPVYELAAVGAPAPALDLDHQLLDLEVDVLEQ